LAEQLLLGRRTTIPNSLLAAAGLAAMLAAQPWSSAPAAQNWSMNQRSAWRLIVVTFITVGLSLTSSSSSSSSCHLPQFRAIKAQMSICYPTMKAAGAVSAATAAVAVVVPVTAPAAFTTYRHQ
jgi:hypothetical protein